MLKFSRPPFFLLKLRLKNLMNYDERLTLLKS